MKWLATRLHTNQHKQLLCLSWGSAVRGCTDPYSSCLCITVLFDVLHLIFPPVASGPFTLLHWRPVVLILRFLLDMLRMSHALWTFIALLPLVVIKALWGMNCHLLLVLFYLQVKLMILRLLIWPWTFWVLLQPGLDIDRRMESSVITLSDPSLF